MVYIQEELCFMITSITPYPKKVSVLSVRLKLFQKVWVSLRIKAWCIGILWTSIAQNVLHPHLSLRSVTVDTAGCLSDGWTFPLVTSHVKLLHTHSTAGYYLEKVRLKAPNVTHLTETCWAGPFLSATRTTWTFQRFKAFIVICT